MKSLKKFPGRGTAPSALPKHHLHWERGTPIPSALDDRLQHFSKRCGVAASTLYADFELRIIDRAITEWENDHSPVSRLNDC